jgi:uncharacterized metal-binding protein
MIPVKDNKFLFRDEKTNAIVNCSDYEYEKYIKIKTEKLKEIEKTKELENDVNKLKTDIEEIKELLKQVIYKEV